MINKDVKIEASWNNALYDEFSKPYFQNLKQFIIDEKKAQIIYPPSSSIFAAFNHTPLQDVKVVIIGQDPYHNPDQANGLCFSVAPGVKIPPSLKNIFKELKADLNIEPSINGDLSNWAKQGVLLLNSVLTVRQNQPASHQKKGWETFTDSVIRIISEQRKDVVFLLWGNYAKTKGQHIDTSKHYVLTATHPSPFSAHNGFFGCKHFSEINNILKSLSLKPIKWQLD